MNKKLISLLMLSIFIISVTFYGCASKDNTAAEVSETTIAVTTQAAKEPVTLTFSTFSSWVTSIDTYTTPISMYEAASGNKVKTETYPDDQFDTILKTKLAAGDAPDVFAGQPKINSPIVKQVEFLSGPWTSQMRPGIESYCAIDGKWFCAPAAPVSYLGMIYNKKIFEKAGVKLPFKTYNDFTAACEAIKKIGVAPLQISNKDGNSSVLYLVGGHYVYEEQPGLGDKLSKNEEKVSDNAGIANTLQRMLDMKKYLKSDYASCDGLTALLQVIKGDVAMFANGSWCYGIYNNAKEFVDVKDKLGDLGMCPMTLGDANMVAVQTHSSGWFVPQLSKHKEEAMALINLAQTPDVVKKLAEKTPGVYPLNIETPVNPWDKEMIGYIDSIKLPVKNQCPEEYLSTIDSSGLNIQGLFVGASPKTTLDEWYKTMANNNKTKRNPGW